MESQKIILVTGSNKGVGYGILISLLKQKTKHKLILTARNDELGLQSLNKLKEEFPEAANQLLYHQLDITKEESINNILKWIKEQFGKIDYLVNNAGVATKGSDFNVQICDFTLGVNVFGTISFTEAMIKNDLIKKNGKIVIVGSVGGTLAYLSSQDLINEFKSAKTTDDLLKLAQRFRKTIEDGTTEKEGWCKNTYRASKMIANTYSRVLSYKKEIIDNNISVYSCHPGWVKTDMTVGQAAPLNIEEGAEMEIYLLNLPEGINPEYQGKYFSKCKVVDFEFFEKKDE